MKLGSNLRYVQHVHVKDGAKPGDPIYVRTPEGVLEAVGGVVVAPRGPGAVVVPVELSEPPVEDYPHPQRPRTRLSVWKEQRGRYQQPSLF